jgi:Putative carbohydrate metabolism domain
MKKYFVIWLAVTSFFTARAQNQLENAGFENWEDIGISAKDTIREPVDWSSLKTSDNESLSPLAPVVCWRSSVAHTGNYSVKLENISTLVIANGTVCNGRVHPNIELEKSYMYTDPNDGRWNNPFTSRPDSITGWYKYIPQGSDTVQAIVILHKGNGRQPDTEYLSNRVATANFRSGVNTGDKWTRFSAPFIYTSDQAPQYALAILNSGNGYTPVAGSIAFFDDLMMIYNSNPVKNEVIAPETIYLQGNHSLVIEGGTDQYLSARILDITGRTVWSGPVFSGRMDISNANLKNGIYIVFLTGKNHWLTQKITVH